MSTDEFDVFMSHNSADKPSVLKLATKLKELGLKPWVDAWHLVPGERWLPALERAIQSSTCCAVIIGPNGMGNVHEDEMWVALQVGMESKQGDRRFRIIPILLPSATRGDRSQLPRFLTANTWVEFHQSIDDPQAIDRLTKAIRGEAPGSGTKLPDGECPYRGLECFDVQHANRFFGREALTDWLLSRLRGTASEAGPTRFLAIVGASGSGKSSLARAGVLAKLKAGELVGSADWPIVICRPENRPLESLATALVAKLEPENLGAIARANTIEGLTHTLLESPDRLHLTAQAAMPPNDPNWKLVIFVDQFEELFTLNVADAETNPSGQPQSTLTPDRIAFVKNLLRAAMIPNGRTIVILTMRADFYGKCALIPELSDAVSSNQQLVGPMSPDELRRAIEIPALLSGSEIESGLVDLLVEEVSGESGTLPLLQYALEELWTESRKNGSGKMTTAAYRQLGGWKGALSRRADIVLAEFRKSQHETVCRNLFLRLVQPGQGTEDTKRLVRWVELRDSDPNDVTTLEHVVRKLADRRLIITGAEESSTDESSPEGSAADGSPPAGGPPGGSGKRLSLDTTVEVIHEALIRDWGELRKWLDADRDGLRTHRQLTEAAMEWSKSHNNPRQRDPSLLYTGSRLAVASELSKQGQMKFNAIENEFLKSSQQAIVNQRRRKQLLVGSIVAGLLVIGMMVRSLINRIEAKNHVDQLMTAKDADVVECINNLKDYQSWAQKPLEQAFSSGSVKAGKLNTAVALATMFPSANLSQTEVAKFLRERLTVATEERFPLIRDALEGALSESKTTGRRTVGKGQVKSRPRGTTALPRRFGGSRPARNCRVSFCKRQLG